MKPFPYIGADKGELKPHLERIFKGEYLIPRLQFASTPIILDIGANIGAYAYWALATYPNAYVFALEPNPANCVDFKANMAGGGVSEIRYHLIRAAVYPTEDKEIPLFSSPINSGMHSIYKSMAASTDGNRFLAPVIHPKDLPNCTVLKMDTEGCEVQILRSYFETHEAPAVVSFEFHNRFDLFELERILGDNYFLATGQVIHPDLGTLNYVHKSVPYDIENA